MYYKLDNLIKMGCWLCRIFFCINQDKVESHPYPPILATGRNWWYWLDPYPPSVNKISSYIKHYVYIPVQLNSKVPGVQYYSVVYVFLCGHIIVTEIFGWSKQFQRHSVILLYLKLSVNILLHLMSCILKLHSCDNTYCYCNYLWV